MYNRFSILIFLFYLLLIKHFMFPFALIDKFQLLFELFRIFTNTILPEMRLIIEITIFFITFITYHNIRFMIPLRVINFRFHRLEFSIKTTNFSSYTVLQNRSMCCLLYFRIVGFHQHYYSY